MRDDVTERYARARGTATRRVEREVLGHEVGLAGFTTVEQAQALSQAVPLPPHGSLLDVGCGYGWPGFHVAQQHGCDLVASDGPLDALRQARTNLLDRGLTGRAVFVAADGRGLPFRTATFDAVVHADVFC